MSKLAIVGLLGLFIVIPISIGILRYRIADRVGRLFLVFVATGLLVDAVMWVLTFLERHNHLLLIFNLYSLTESFFFFWFLWATAPSNSIKEISKILLYCTPPFWIVCIFVLPLMTKEVSGGGAFATTYYIIVSFLAGFAMLQLVEKEKSVFSDSMFWFTLGIFFCSFCTFYIMTFVQTFISQQIWFLNNIFNIIIYLFYTFGFWHVKPKLVADQSIS